MRLRSKFWLEVGGELVFSDWRADLLELIGETGSVAAAAARLDVSYRVAWGKIKEMEKRLGLRLVESRRGGRGGGLSRLTPQAEDLVKSYRRFKSGLQQQVDERFRTAFGLATGPPGHM